MLPSERAALAYQSSASHRGLRMQEADIFRRATGALRVAQTSNVITRVRALADNRRLWVAVIDSVRDPDNALPESLRASIASVGMAVQREMDHDNPDFEFLISINENMTEGLLGAR